jgi:hypothetical protein
MRITVLLAVLVVAFLVFPGCQQKKAEITGWQAYTDDYFKVTFSYPTGWVLDNKTRQAMIYSSPDAAQKFFDRDPRKQDGVQIIVAAEPGKTGKDAATYIQAYQKEQQDAGFTVKDTEPVSIEGLAGSKVQFAGNFDETTRVTTIRAAVVKDSVLYYFQYSAFNDLFEPYKLVFDSVLTSLVLPRKIVVEKGVDPAIPFVTTQKFQNEEITLDYPENFNVTSLPLKGEQTFRIQIVGSLDGARQDCAFDISSRPAKKLTVDKVVAQNEKNFSPISKGESQISGEKAVFFNYKIKDARFAQVKNRVYFVVKNDKLYQVIFNYFAPKEKEFLPPFEKLVASIRIK